MLRKPYDMAIIGHDLTSLILSTELEANGFQVIQLVRGHFPKHCSPMVFYSQPEMMALAHYGMEINSIPHAVIKTVSVFNSNGKVLRKVLNDNAYGIGSYHLYDQLVDKALGLGVIILQGNTSIDLAPISQHKHYLVKTEFGEYLSDRLINTEFSETIPPKQLKGKALYEGRMFKIKYHAPLDEMFWVMAENGIVQLTPIGNNELIINWITNASNAMPISKLQNALAQFATWNPAMEQIDVSERDMLFNWPIGAFHNLKESPNNFGEAVFNGVSIIPQNLYSQIKEAKALASEILQANRKTEELIKTRTSGIGSLPKEQIEIDKMIQLMMNDSFSRFPRSFYFSLPSLGLRKFKPLWGN